MRLLFDIARHRLSTMLSVEKHCVTKPLSEERFIEDTVQIKLKLKTLALGHFPRRGTALIATRTQFRDAKKTARRVPHLSRAGHSVPTMGSQARMICTRSGARKKCVGWKEELLEVPHQE